MVSGPGWDRTDDLFHVGLPVIAVLQLLYTEGRMISGFFLKKKPPRTQLNRAHELENCSKARVYSAGFMRGLKPPFPSGSSFAERV